MALHLNFYHEIHREEKQRARDPRKLAKLAGVVLVVIMVGYYFYRSSSVSGVQQELNRLRGEWAQLNPKAKQAEVDAGRFQAEARKNAALVEAVEGRFYWAPLLERVSAVVPPTVQIQSLGGDYIVERGKKEVNVLLRGVAAGSDPRGAAEKFRVGLREQLAKNYTNPDVSFDANSLEVAEETVTYEGKSLPVARFRLRLVFDPAPPAKPEGETEPAQPAP